MPSLLELQLGFAAAMRGQGERVHGAIDGRAIGVSARLGIYRHAIDATRLRTLASTYPTVQALVGEAFFEQLARRYAARHPSLCGDLCAYGDSFARFIEQSPEAIGPVPYLAEVARFEWLRQEAAFAADADPLEREHRAPCASAEPHALGVRFHSSVRTFRSDFPILSIHRWCETSAGDAPTLADGAECGLIWREGDQVAASVVHPSSYACIESLRAGQSVGEAAAAGSAVDPEFVPAECLQDLLDRGLIVEFTDSNRSA
ncbi:MAG: putative DNA-binding domain-containing protein [Gammaproteobacteria bacterium]|nr:putative DNA-binding domain-containing protein [Gammaproteobacteria bacterium]